MPRDNPPAWILHDPQVVHQKEVGWKVRLPIAEGWPVAYLSANHAEELGKQLIEAAKRARNPSAQE